MQTILFRLLKSKKEPAKHKQWAHILLRQHSLFHTLSVFVLNNYVNVSIRLLLLMCAVSVDKTTEISSWSADIPSPWKDWII